MYTRLKQEQRQRAHSARYCWNAFQVPVGTTAVVEAVQEATKVATTNQKSANPVGADLGCQQLELVLGTLADFALWVVPGEELQNAFT